MHPMNPSTVVLWILVPLIAWRIYARVRRQIGRQRLAPARTRIAVVAFPLLVLLLAAAALPQPLRLAWLAAGLVLGAVLGSFALRHTRFEVAPEGLYYTPNAHLGVAVSLLLVGRIAWRFYQVSTFDPAHVPASGDFARSPGTLAVFGILAGYYVRYAIGLLRWRSRVRTGAAGAPASGDG